MAVTYLAKTHLPTIGQVQYIIKTILILLFLIIVEFSRNILAELTAQKGAAILSAASPGSFFGRRLKPRSLKFQN